MMSVVPKGVLHDRDTCDNICSLNDEMVYLNPSTNMPHYSDVPEGVSKGRHVNALRSLCHDWGGRLKRRNLFSWPQTYGSVASPKEVSPS